MKCFEGILNFIDEQKMFFDNKIQMKDVMEAIRMKQLKIKMKRII